jgi:hypothetical protein
MMTPPFSPTPIHPESQVESDPRFPSGPWYGFFLMAHLPGRHMMELDLTFRQGVMTGEGRDLIGTFLIRGRYQLQDGQCWWTKKYIGKHDVSYRGYNEGKGIWGLWEIPPHWRGGFYIWPKSMGDPTRQTLTESIDEPLESESEENADQELQEVEPLTVGAQAGVPS